MSKMLDELLSGLSEGQKQISSGGDTGDLISKALTSLQETSQKYGEKAMKAEQSAKRYGMIGNILTGIGGLANTVNMSVQGLKHGRRGLPIGDPAMQVGQHFAGQGKDFESAAERFQMAQRTDPAQMLAIQQAQQKQDLHPLQKSSMEADIAYKKAAAAKLSREGTEKDKRTETERLIDSYFDLEEQISGKESMVGPLQKGDKQKLELQKERRDIIKRIIDGKTEAKSMSDINTLMNMANMFTRMAGQLEGREPKKAAEYREMALKAANSARSGNLQFGGQATDGRPIIKLD